jgi:NAD(P)-dependent dehydrogenase (short-subunit alcohol dehydrogenase family)
MSERKLEGKAAIVTGGAQGIGGETARRLAADGARVLIVDIDEKRAAANAKRIQAAGGAALHMAGDVARPEVAREMVEQAMEAFGRLDILVQNAFGISSEASGGGAVEVEPGAWRAGMDLLVGALYLGAKYAVPAMQESGAPEGFDPTPFAAHGLHQGEPPPVEVGRIVNMASVHGLLQAPGMMVYEAGKAAVIGLTRQMAVEYGPLGITVNAIAPGHIVTEKLQKSWEETSNPEGYRLWELMYPVRRAGRMADIAAAISFLCSADASFITGVCLPVDGGLTLQIQENVVIDLKAYIQENPRLRTLFDAWGWGTPRR